jgi:hypothetical protein
MLTAWPDHLRHRPFTAAELCDCALLPVALLNHWQAREFLSPVGGGGKGTARRFSFETVYKTTIAAILTRQGLPVGDAFSAVGRLGAQAAEYLVVDPRPDAVPGNWPLSARYVPADRSVAELFGHGPALIPASMRGTPPASISDSKGRRNVSALVVDVSAVVERIVAVVTRTASPA